MQGSLALWLIASLGVPLPPDVPISVHRRADTGPIDYNPAKGTFRFQPGPVFANILLVDEINRATPRAQAACWSAWPSARSPPRVAPSRWSHRSS